MTTIFHLVRKTASGYVVERMTETCRPGAKRAQYATEDVAVFPDRDSALRCADSLGRVVNA